MPTLFFPDPQTLRLLLAASGVPATICGAPASAGFDPQGRLWLTTSAWLPRETLLILSRYGVQVLGSSNVPVSETVSCWHELVPLETAAPSPEQFRGTVLFEAPGRLFASLTSEMERLGAASWSYRWLHDLDQSIEDDRVLIKTIAPPYATLLRVLDDAGRFEEIDAHVEQSPRVWVAAGYRHPLAERIVPPPHQVLFLSPPRRWQWRDERRFSDATAAPASEMPPSLPADIRSGSRAPAHAGRGIETRLRLLPQADDTPPELWVFRDDPLGWLVRLVRAADQSLVARFLFAVTPGNGRPCLLLRAQRGSEPPPVVVSDVIGYRPLLKLANLWGPCGFRLEPLPRRDTLRRLFTANTKRLTWLQPAANGAFEALSVPLSAFRPLHEAVEYRIENEQRPLKAWQSSTAWDFEQFAIAPESPPRRNVPIAASTAMQPPAKTSESQTAADERTAKPGKIGRVMKWLLGVKDASMPVNAEPAQEPPILPEAAADAAATVRSLSPTTKVAEASKRALALKSQFLQLLTRLTRDDRLYFWPELGKAFAESQEPAEAAVCWLNALWEQDPGMLSPAWAWSWLRAEAAQAAWNPQQASLVDWLAAAPRPARVRSLAAYALWATLQESLPPGFQERIGALRGYLDANERELPVRAAWLARVALARISRGDVLALAQTRDRLFSRLHQDGLSLDLDAPVFIRYGDAADPDRLDTVRKKLLDKRKLIQQWIAQLAPNEQKGHGAMAVESVGLQAEVPCTQAYADLMLAWGLARLGEKTEGARLRDQAWQKLDDADPIHAWLKSAFDYRIRQAREGKSAGGPLPPELLGCLAAMPDDDRYRIDRLRQHSRILDPSEQINAYWASTLRHYRHWDEWRRRLVDLPGLAADELDERASALLAQAAGESPAALPVVILHLLDVAQRLAGGLREKLLELLPAALDRAGENTAASTNSTMQLKLLEKGLLFAASFDRPSAVQPLFQRFVGLVERLRRASASPWLEGLTGQTFRCLRRLGMKREAFDVLGRIHDFLGGGEPITDVRRKAGNRWPVLARTLLHIAAAYCYCGQEDLGLRIIDPIKDHDLYGRSMPTAADQTALAITYASILSHLKVPTAMGRFEELFQRLKRISVNGWNSHYTRQPLELLDTALLAVVSDEFTLGPTARGWLDDDEYLVRQRIHLELKELMSQEGV